MSSKHLQTRRLLATLQAYLYEIRGMLIALWREANERPEAFVDHAGVLRDARTGKAIEEAADEKEDEEMCKWCCAQSSLTPSRGPAGRRNRKMTLIPLQSADSASSMLVRLKRRLHRQRGGDRRSVSNQPTNQSSGSGTAVIATSVSRDWTVKQF